MSILVNCDTKVLCQGITGKEGSYHTKEAILYGTSVVAGVTPGKGGLVYFNIPIYNSIKDAKSIHSDINATVIYVPAKYAVDSIIEAIDSNIELIICITEGIPVLDMIFIKSYLIDKHSILIGPNCPGIISPGECKIGIMPGNIHLKGCVGIVSRSGTLTYEAVYQTTMLGLGQSTCVGIGGDKILGMSFIDAIKMFNEDVQTKIILMIGEIGGILEIEAGLYVKNNMIKSKPIAVYIAGIYAPIGKKMGHSGAIIYNELDTVKEKIRILFECGFNIINDPTKIGLELKKLLC
ncbi:MAG: succinate--CoA ligase subunit alpha [Candidatus Azosocius agrarius]|nr:MAG: succinate--CoA ligase subunit alpha [Gammaproteobacteria bacterium]